MTNTTPHSIAADPSQRPVRGSLDQETIVKSRQSPWEPGSGAGASKILVGVAGAAIVGGIALAIVTMGPAPGAKKATADRVAAAQVARDPAAQMNAEPPAAGTAPAAAPQDADTAARSADTAPATQPAPTAARGTANSPPAGDTSTTSSTATVPPPVVDPAPSPAQPKPERTPGQATPTPGE